MPNYDFKCRTCGHTFEKIQSYKDPNPQCPAVVPLEADDITSAPVGKPCGGETEKLISKGGTFILKGGGWYKDGY